MIHKNPSREAQQEPTCADELRHRDGIPGVRLLWRICSGAHCGNYQIIGSVIHSSRVEAYGQEETHLSEICDNLLCEKWKEGIVYQDKEGFWWRRVHTCAGSQHTFPRLASLASTDG